MLQKIIPISPIITLFMGNTVIFYHFLNNISCCNHIYETRRGKKLRQGKWKLKQWDPSYLFHKMQEPLNLKEDLLPIPGKVSPL